MKLRTHKKPKHVLNVAEPCWNVDVLDTHGFPLSKERFGISHCLSIVALMVHRLKWTISNLWTYMLLTLSWFLAISHGFFKDVFLYDLRSCTANLMRQFNSRRQLSFYQRKICSYAYNYFIKDNFLDCHSPTAFRDARTNKTEGQYNKKQTRKLFLSLHFLSVPSNYNAS